MYEYTTVAAAFCLGVAFTMLFVIVCEKYGAVKEERAATVDYLGDLFRSYGDSRGLGHRYVRHTVMLQHNDGTLESSDVYTCFWCEESPDESTDSLCERRQEAAYYNEKPY